MSHATQSQTPTAHPCSIEGCNAPAIGRRCDDHQRQLDQNLAIVTRGDLLDDCPCPWCNPAEVRR